MRSGLSAVSSTFFNTSSSALKILGKKVISPLISRVSDACSWANNKMPEPMQGILADAGCQASAAFRQVTSCDTFHLITTQPQLREVELASFKANATYAAMALGTSWLIYQAEPDRDNTWTYSATYYLAASALMLFMMRQRAQVFLEEYASKFSISKVAYQIASEHECHANFPACGCGRREYLSETMNEILKSKKILEADIHHTIRLMVTDAVLSLASFLPYSAIPVTFLKWIATGQNFLDYKLSLNTCTKHRQAAFNQNNFFVLALGGLFYLTIEGIARSVSSITDEDHPAVRVAVTALVSQYFMTTMILNREALPGKGKEFDIFYDSPLLTKEAKQWMSSFIQWAKSCLSKKPDTGMNLSDFFNTPVLQATRDIAQVILLYPNLGFWQNMMRHDVFYLFVQHYEDKLKLLMDLDDSTFLKGMISFSAALYTRLSLKKIMFMAPDKTITPLKIVQDVIKLCRKQDVSQLKEEIRLLLAAKKEADHIRHAEYSPSAKDSEAETEAFKELEIFLKEHEETFSKLLDESLSEEDFTELLESHDVLRAEGFVKMETDNLLSCVIDNYEPQAVQAKEEKKLDLTSFVQEEYDCVTQRAEGSGSPLCAAGLYQRTNGAPIQMAGQSRRLESPIKR